MKSEELEVRLADAENLLVLQGKRITPLKERKIEPQEIKVPDSISSLFPEVSRLAFFAAALKVAFDEVLRS
jgi:hypothetical protein